MKKINFILALLMLTVVYNCDKDDAIVNTVYDSVNGQTGVGFVTGASSVIVPPEGITSTVGIRTTNTTDVDRTFNVSVNEELSSGNSADYVIGTVNVPANSYEGSISVTFQNFDNLPDLVNQTLVLDLDLPEGTAVVGQPSVTFTYLKFVICNDLELVINGDQYGSETTWEVTDSEGAVVESGGPFSDIVGGAQYNFSFTLDDGCYTFTIYDAFGDGLFDGNITGNYALTCSVITHASGSGNFGGSQSTDFCVNQ